MRHSLVNLVLVAFMSMEASGSWNFYRRPKYSHVPSRHYSFPHRGSYGSSYGSYGRPSYGISGIPSRPTYSSGSGNFGVSSVISGVGTGSGVVIPTGGSNFGVGGVGGGRPTGVVPGGVGIGGISGNNFGTGGIPGNNFGVGGIPGNNNIGGGGIPGNDNFAGAGSGTPLLGNVDVRVAP